MGRVDRRRSEIDAVLALLCRRMIAVIRRAHPQPDRVHVALGDATGTVERDAVVGVCETRDTLKGRKRTRVRTQRA